MGLVKLHGSEKEGQKEGWRDAEREVTGFQAKMMHHALAAWDMKPPLGTAERELEGLRGSVRWDMGSLEEDRLAQQETGLLSSQQPEALCFLEPMGRNTVLWTPWREPGVGHVARLFFSFFFG